MAITTYLGTFMVSTGGGTQNVDVTGYGAGGSLPDLSAASAGSWAIIFWWAAGGTAVGTWGGHAEAGIGFTTGTSNSYAASMVSVNGQTTTIAGRALKAKAVNFNYTSGGDVIAADFTSMLAGGGFRLGFAGPGNLGTQPVNFMLINGLTNAKVVVNDSPGSSGNQSVTNIGFQPDLVLLAHNLAGAVASIPVANTPARLGFGAFNKHGQQWANGVLSMNGVTTSDEQRYQQTDACVAIPNNDLSITAQAHFVSMDANGYTLNWSSAPGASAIIALALKGVSSKLGAFNGATGPQTVNSRHGFTPRGALFSTISSAATASPQTFSLWSMGATDMTNHASMGMAARDGVTTTNAQSVWYNTASLIAPNGAASPGVEAQGYMSGASPANFTVTWASVASDEFLYLLIGDSGTNSFPAKVAT